MKLILTVVVDIDGIEEAISEYRAVEENWTIAAAKLDKEDFHPSLYESNREAEEVLPKTEEIPILEETSEASPSCPYCRSPMRILSKAPYMVECSNPKCTNRFR